MMPKLRKSPDPRGKPWTAERILFALLYRRANIFDNWCMHEFEIAGGRADLVSIRRDSRYATEYEIKISLADLQADILKDKWKSKGRKYIKYFYYVIPDILAGKIPADLPPGAGILVVSDGAKVAHWDRLPIDTISTLRPAVANPDVERVPEEHIKSMHKNCYFKYWRLEFARRRKALYGS